MSSFEDDLDIESLEKLFKDFDIAPLTEAFEGRRNLGELFKEILKSPPEAFKRIGKDVAIVCGMSGDWQLSLEVIRRLIELNVADEEIKLWQLRALVEQEQYAEGIAVLHAVSWDKAQLKHVNYLAGIAFERLGLREESQKRFAAVLNADPDYRDVRARAQKF